MDRGSESLRLCLSHRNCGDQLGRAGSLTKLSENGRTSQCPQPSSRGRTAEVRLQPWGVRALFLLTVMQQGASNDSELQRLALLVMIKALFDRRSQSIKLHCDMPTQLGADA